MKTFGEFVNESSLSRIYQHMKDGIPFATITAYRKVNDKKTNEINNKKLRVAIRQSNFEYVEVEGSYPEPQKDGSVVVVKEKSFFVFAHNKGEGELLKRLVIQLGRKFEQDSVLFKDCDDVVFFIYK